MEGETRVVKVDLRDLRDFTRFISIFNFFLRFARAPSSRGLFSVVFAFVHAFVFVKRKRRRSEKSRTKSLRVPWGSPASPHSPQRRIFDSF